MRKSKILVKAKTVEISDPLIPISNSDELLSTILDREKNTTLRCFSLLALILLTNLPSFPLLLPSLHGFLPETFTIIRNLYVVNHRLLILLVTNHLRVFFRYQQQKKQCSLTISRMCLTFRYQHKRNCWIP